MLNHFCGICIFHYDNIQLWLTLSSFYCPAELHCSKTTWRDQKCSCFDGLHPDERFQPAQVWSSGDFDMFRLEQNLSFSLQRRLNKCTVCLRRWVSLCLKLNLWCRVSSWTVGLSRKNVKTTIIIWIHLDYFFFWSTSAGYLREQNRPGRAGALSPLPPLSPPAAGHTVPPVQHLGQYGYDQPANVPIVYAPNQR